MKRKLTAELWDKMHYLFRDFLDRSHQCDSERPVFQKSGDHPAVRRGNLEHSGGCGYRDPLQQTRRHRWCL